MAWPTTVTLTYLDADTDSPLSARPQIKAIGDAVNDIIAERASADGIASLDASGLVPQAQVPNTLSSSGSNDINLLPGSERTSFQNIINLNPRTVTQLNALTASEGDVAYCSNGDAGSACAAVYNGTDWKVVSLGTTISTT
jgi:hypothetical protein